MEIEEFLDTAFKRRQLQFTSSYCENLDIMTRRVSWRFIREARKLAGEIDFDKICQFDKNGFCSRENNGRRGDSRTAMCCCESCRRTVGYLNQIPKDVDTIKMYARNFNDRTGFWRKGKGCVLPREYRSRICVKYICLGKEYLLSDREKLILDMVANPYKYYLRYSNKNMEIAKFIDFELKKWVKKDALSTKKSLARD